MIANDVTAFLFLTPKHPFKYLMCSFAVWIKVMSLAPNAVQPQEY